MKHDISIELRNVTFLMSYDTSVRDESLYNSLKRKVVHGKIGRIL